MLKSIKAKNFRLFESLELLLESDVPTVLIGANSSGKTSVIEILDIVKGLLKRETQDVFSFGRFGFQFVQRAGSRTGIELELLFDPGPGSPTEKDNAPVCHGCTLKGAAGGFILYEREWVRIFKHGLDASPLPLMERKGTQTKLRNIRTQVYDDVQFDGNRSGLMFGVSEEMYPTIAHVKKSIEGLSVYPGFLTTALWARDPREGEYSPRNSVVIAPIDRMDMRGFELTNVLSRLQNQHDECFRELLGHIQAEFPFFKKLYILPDAGGGKISFAWEDIRFPGVPMYPFQMSEGLLEFLLQAAVLLLPSNQTAIVLDEPDCHLHPSAIRRLMSIAHRAASRCPVLIVTHSDRALRYLSDPLRSIRICRVENGRASVGMLDKERLETWLAEYRADDLREKGFLDVENSESR